MKLPNDPLPVGAMSLKDVNLHTLRIEMQRERTQAIQEAYLQTLVQAWNQEQQEL